jgi:hypothetical protein
VLRFPIGEQEVETRSLRRRSVHGPHCLSRHAPRHSSESPLNRVSLCLFELYQGTLLRLSKTAKIVKNVLSLVASAAHAFLRMLTIGMSSKGEVNLLDNLPCRSRSHSFRNSTLGAAQIPLL